MKNKKPKNIKGVYYFPTHGEAKQYAIEHGHPCDRLIIYKVGWAIQLSVSGPYVGPETPEKKGGAS